MPDAPFTDGRRFDCRRGYDVCKFPYKVTLFYISVRHEENADCLDLVVDGTVL